MLWKLSSSTCVTVLIVHCTPIPSIIENLPLDWGPGPLWLRARVRDVSCCDARMHGCWDSGRVPGRETAGWRVDATCRCGQGRDRLLHVASSLGSAMCWQPVRRRHRQLYSASVKRLTIRASIPRPYIYMTINFSNNVLVYMAPNKVLRCASPGSKPLSLQTLPQWQSTTTLGGLWAERSRRLHWRLQRLCSRVPFLFSEQKASV